MRPRTNRFALDVWIVRERAVVKLLEAALLCKSIRTWSFDHYRFAEANPIRSFFIVP
jgi:hypothetical protein